MEPINRGKLDGNMYQLVTGSARRSLLQQGAGRAGLSGAPDTWDIAFNYFPKLATEDLVSFAYCRATAAAERSMERRPW